jgi:hypothetical protein
MNSPSVVQPLAASAQAKSAIERRVTRASLPLGPSLDAIGSLPFRIAPRLQDAQAMRMSSDKMRFRD